MLMTSKGAPLVGFDQGGSLLRYLAVAHSGSPFVTVYDWITGSPVKMADPSDLPAGVGNGAAWSPDGRYLVIAHTTTPYVTIYDWDTGSPVKITNPGTLSLGTTAHVIADALAANDYLYLVSVGATAAAYTAGRFVLTLYGRPV